MYTGGLVWVVGMVSPERRGRAIGLYGLCVWSGFTIGPPLGQIAHELGGSTPSGRWPRCRRRIGAAGGRRLPRRRRRRSTRAGGSCCRPGRSSRASAAASQGIGIAAINGFVVLLCIDRGVRPGQRRHRDRAVRVLDAGRAAGRRRAARPAGAAAHDDDRRHPRRHRAAADRRRSRLVGGRPRLHPVRHLLDAAVPGARDAGRRRGRAVAARRRPGRVLELLRPRVRRRCAGARADRVAARATAPCT